MLDKVISRIIGVIILVVVVSVVVVKVVIPALNDANTYTDISLADHPDDIELAIGDDITKFIGAAEVTAKNGNKTTISITADMIRGYNPLGADRQNITITYGNYSEEFTVVFVNHDLSIPKNLRIADGRMEWDPVIRALSYSVKVDGTAYTGITAASYVLDNSFSAGAYEIQVMAAGNESNIFSSDYSVPINASKPNAPAGISIDGGVLKWDAVEGYTRYRVLLDGEFADIVNSPEYAIPNSISSGNHEYAVAVAGGNVFLDSARISCSVTKLSTPAGLAVNNDVVSWGTVTGCINYRLSVSGGTSYTTDAGTTSYDLFAVLAQGNYTLSVTAIGDRSATLTSEASGTIGYDVTDTIIGISTKQELNDVRYGLSGKYALMNDITLTSDWSPIMGFKGTLNGKGHTIKGLTINTLSETGSGLFGTLSGTVRNLKIEANIDANNAGGIAGISTGIINNCEVSGTIGKSTADYGGGIAGRQTGGNISGNVNRADITGASYVGGIAGYILWNNNTSYKIEGCTNDGAISGLNRVGGIAGSISATLDTRSDRSSSVSACTNNGVITSTGDSAGGIAGYAAGGYYMYLDYYYHRLAFSSCENHADITGKNYVAGILGSKGSYVTNGGYCTNSGVITADTANKWDVMA